MKSGYTRVSTEDQNPAMQLPVGHLASLVAGGVTVEFTLVYRCRL